MQESEAVGATFQPSEERGNLITSYSAIHLRAWVAESYTSTLNHDHHGTGTSAHTDASG